MKSAVWTNVLKTCVDPQRVQQHLDQLAVTDAGPRLRKASTEQARILVAVLSGSQALSTLLLAHPDWLESLQPDFARHPRQAQGLRREVEGWLQPLLQGRDYAEAFRRLRFFKQREMLRIAARDLARLGQVTEITREISDVAEVCLETVWRLCREQFVERFGQPHHEDAGGGWQPTMFCVLGLGKLGGQELNYSSDVDVMFVYSEEGQVFKAAPTKNKVAGRGLSNHEFFKRLAEAFIAEVSLMAPAGTLYRIDLRLRPEGDAGPLVRSLGSYENYYAQWGQTWERMMLIKARGVAGDKSLAAEFLETLQHFRYPRSVNERVLREVADMKNRIENEVVKAGEIDRNVKLGRGGIREIEFIAQSLQLLHGGRQPFLQDPQTLPGLEKLAKYKLLPPDDTAALSAAYCFLRDVEHRLQMEDNQQTHTIPTSRQARERLARLMGFDTIKEFEAGLKKHTRYVRYVYDRILGGEETETKEILPRDFEGREAEWKEILAAHAFRDPEKAVRLLHEFAHGPGYVHVSQRTVELARELIPRLLALCRVVGRASCLSSEASQAYDTAGRQDACPTLSDPDRVLTRLDSFITAYGTRAMLFEMWAGHPALFDLLLLLFDRSEFLAETAIRTPDLVDELVLSGRLRQSKSAAETLKDLRYGQKDEDQRLWLRRYHQAELMRIGLRDILGLADYEQNLVELTALADACLQYALETVLRRHLIKSPPLVVIGLGKLGGKELGYGSDLDIVFVADVPARDLPRLQAVAVETMDMLSARTEQGMAFVTDARLRPDGEKGLLVNSLDAYEEYYRQRAQLWEIQALTRTRPIAGNLKAGERFQQLAASLTDFRAFPRVGDEATRLKRYGAKSSPAIKSETSHVVSYTPDWKQAIHAMRLRIEKERTPPGQDELAIKTGQGGLMDAEFIAQAHCLEHGWQEANTLAALQRARDAVGVQPSGCSSAPNTLKRELQPSSATLTLEDWDKLIENYRHLRRVEGILRRWSYEGETVLPVEPAPYYRVSVRCGFATPEEFRAAVAAWRKTIREVYGKVFSIQ